MVSSKTLSSLAFFLVLLPIITLAQTIPSSPFFPLPSFNPLNPFNGSVCNFALCGKGQCVTTTNSTLGYKCQCDAGWTQSLTPDLSSNFDFLPCVIPQCLLPNISSCQLPPFPQLKPVPLNSSLFDPCYWMYCGGGTCQSNSTLTYSCSCNPGFSNLLHKPYFPCLNFCSIGSNCTKLGIAVEKPQYANLIATANVSENEGNSIMAGKFMWMVILFMSMLMVFSK